MRRFAAILLISLFGFQLCGQAFISDAAGTLPSCCRREGRHHCAMRDGTHAGDSGSKSRFVRSRCAQYRETGVFTPQSVTAVVASAEPHPGVLPGFSSALAQAEAGYRISFSRARQKRGPPIS